MVAGVLGFVCAGFGFYELLEGVLLVYLVCLWLCFGGFSICV